MLNILHNNFTTLPDSMHNFNRWLKNSDERTHCRCTCHPHGGWVLYTSAIFSTICEQNNRWNILIQQTHTVSVSHQYSAHSVHSDPFINVQLAMWCPCYCTSATLGRLSTQPNTAVSQLVSRRSMRSFLLSARTHAASLEPPQYRDDEKTVSSRPICCTCNQRHVSRYGCQCWQLQIYTSSSVNICHYVVSSPPPKKKNKNKKKNKYKKKRQ